MNDTDLFRFLAAKAAAGVRTALVTVTAVSGSSMRNPGAHMAVADDGEWRGSLSGGCIEAAVVAEARETIAAGEPREVRFGAGSRYIDIRLPCGGSLDVLINPLDDNALAARAAELFEAREPFVLSLPLAGGESALEEAEPEWRTCRESDRFRVAHVPPLALLIIGHGAAVEALHDLAVAAQAVVRVMTPDETIAARLEARGAAVRRLRTPDETAPLYTDRWTAIAFLFHDHDWERALVARALAGPAFYVGAMGSHVTQRRRVAMLAESGAPAAAIARLHGPIGLIPSSRDPQVLALSVLAEIVRDYERITARPDWTAVPNT